MFWLAGFWWVLGFDGNHQEFEDGKQQSKWIHQTRTGLHLKNQKFIWSPNQIFSFVCALVCKYMNQICRHKKWLSWQFKIWALGISSWLVLLQITHQQHHCMAYLCYSSYRPLTWLKFFFIFFFFLLVLAIYFGLNEKLTVNTILISFGASFAIKSSSLSLLIWTTVMNIELFLHVIKVWLMKNSWSKLEQWLKQCRCFPGSCHDFLHGIG